MSRIDLKVVMDAIGATIRASGASRRVFPYPVEKAEVPCVIVGYPEDIDFDLTFANGSDEATFPIWFLVGMVVGKASRDKLSATITGAPSIKTALDGNLGGVVQTARVTRCRPDVIKLAGGDYLAARFDLEVVT